ncbi:MAG: hypothetical protein HQL49_10935 [Gammaproteobacteria bacterium]|nr:hypothetical protein [Gammaproteobacteria bacterium]
METPGIDEQCGKHFVFRDFFECSDTWRKTRIENIPRELDTYHAIKAITEEILDPVQDEFGKVRITYGFSSAALVKEIKKNPYPNITPSTDQHSGHELNKNNTLICKRRGIAVDFYVDGISSQLVACWVAENTNFDRLYFYSSHSPFHVSFGPERSKSIIWMEGYIGGRHQPHNYTLDKLKALRAC